jgi:hypothetical protein
MNGEETRFKHGNKAAEKWTIELAKEVFSHMLEYTQKNNNVLSVQQAYIDYGIPCVTYYYLLEKFPELEPFKKGINDTIISRVNKGALEGDYNPTAGIWRMKQLGEKDEKHQDITTKGESINKQLSPEDARKLREDLLNDI